MNAANNVKEGKKNASARVRQYLKAQPPLTIITLQDLYANLAEDSSENAAIRTGLYRQSVDTPVSRLHLPSYYYAIRLELQEIEPGFEVFLSLRGIPRERLSAEVKAIADEIIARLQQHYGKNAISFWGRAAQRRSVDQARAGMKQAKDRDEFCRLCLTVNNLRQARGSTLLKPQTGFACHVLSRRASFWALLDTVHHETGNIFSDESTYKLKERLTADPFHSHSDHIIRLCHQHNAILLAALKRA